MIMGAPCTEENCRFQLKHKSLMIYHILTENNSKTFGWHCLQVIGWEGSKQKDTQKTDEQCQLKRPKATVTSFLLLNHNRGVPDGWQGKNRPTRHPKTVGEVQKPIGHNTGIQEGHRNGVITQSEGALIGEIKIKGQDK